MIKNNKVKREVEIIPTIRLDAINNVESIVNELNKRNIDLIRYTLNRDDLDLQVEFLQMLQSIYNNKVGKKLRLWLDLSWPKDKIRFQSCDGYPIQLEKDEKIYISNISGRKSETMRSFYIDKDFSEIKFHQLMVGEELMIEFIEVAENEMIAKCLNNMYLKVDKAVSSIDNYIIQSSSEIEKRAMILVKSLDVELCILSYIETAEDYIKAKDKILKLSNQQINFMSKIESYKGVCNKEKIIDISDSIMIPRGCLALNLGISHFWGVQNTILADCNEKSKKVYLASSVLRSLDKNIIPSRTDVGDLSSFINKGITGVILTNSFNTTNFASIDRYYLFINNLFNLYWDSDRISIEQLSDYKFY